MNNEVEMNSGAQKKLWKLINYFGGTIEAKGIKVCSIKRGLTITRDAWAVEVTYQDAKFQIVWGHSSDSSVRTSQGKDVDAIACFNCFNGEVTYEGNTKLAKIFTRCLPAYQLGSEDIVERGIPDQVWKALQTVKDATWLDQYSDDEHGLIDIFRGRIKASDQEKERAKEMLREIMKKDSSRRKFIQEFEEYTGKL